MDLSFSGEIWHWRGPAPYHFVTVPDPERDAVASVARLVTYGWGMVPAVVRIGGTEWSTALWPKDGGYIVPVTKKVQTDEDLGVGDEVTVRLHIDA